MLNYILKPIRHPSFYKKYAGKRYLKVGLYMSAPVELTHILLIGKLIHETVGARSLAREYTSITGCRVACTEGRNSDGGTVGRGAPRSMFIRNGEEFAIMLWLSIKLFVFFILVCYVHRSHSILTHQPHAESVSSTHPHFTNPAFHNNRLLSSIHFVPQNSNFRSSLFSAHSLWFQFLSRFYPFTLSGFCFSALVVQ